MHQILQLSRRNLVTVVAQLRRALTVFLVGIALFIGAAFGGFGSDEAIADPMMTQEASSYHPEPTTPEATSYEVEGVDHSSRVETKSSRDNAPIGTSDFDKDVRQGLKGAVENVREKLNLDQPIAPETKEFLNDIQNPTD